MTIHFKFLRKSHCATNILSPYLHNVSVSGYIDKYLDLLIPRFEQLAVAESGRPL